MVRSGITHDHRSTSPCPDIGMSHADHLLEPPIPQPLLYRPYSVLQLIGS